ncbi:MAG: hypothetical protein JW888_03885 [Pirellulales bacterium]|nr:hypothetical protein [Pirellulales bacterium]
MNARFQPPEFFWMLVAAMRSGREAGGGGSVRRTIDRRRSPSCEPKTFRTEGPHPVIYPAGFIRPPPPP